MLTFVQFFRPALVPAIFGLGDARSLRKVNSMGHEGVILPGPGALVGLIFLSRHFEAGRLIDGVVE